MTRFLRLKPAVVATALATGVVLGASQIAGTVWLSVTVVDQSGASVPGLQQTDFTVRVSDATQSLTYFSAKPAPFAAVLLLDESESVRSLRPFIYKAAAEFVAHFRRGDRLTLATFAQHTYIGGGFTANRLAIENALGKIARQQRIYDGPPCQAPAALSAQTAVYNLSATSPLRKPPQRNGTALWDALECAANELSTDAEAIKRLIVVITDGEDASSYGTQQTAAAAIRRAGATVWATGVVENTPSARTLQEIADESGGRYLVLRREEDIARAFRMMTDEVRSQYLLGFKPAEGITTGRVDVSVTKPSLTVRSRRTFQISR